MSAKSQPPQLRVRARVEGLEWHSGLLDLPISRGNLDFTFSDGEIGVEGDVVLDSSPVHVTLRHRVDDAEPRDSVRVEGQLDPATARAVGLPERRFLDGSVGVAASYTRNHDGAAEVQARLDLTAAALELAEAGIAKPVGEKASARMEARVDPAGTLDGAGRRSSMRRRSRAALGRRRRPSRFVSRARRSSGCGSARASSPARYAGERTAASA